MDDAKEAIKNVRASDRDIIDIQMLDIIEFEMSTYQVYWLIVHAKRLIWFSKTNNMFPFLHMHFWQD